MSDRSSSVCGIMSKTLAVLNGVGLVVATLGALRMRGDFLDIYRDLLSGQSLPVVTQFVLSVPSWTVLLVAMVLLGILAIKELIRPKWIPLCLNILWAVVGIAVSFLVATAMIAPLMQIIEQMGSG